jgi:metal-dependent hydrolase (beta-lactamase superfamily II)/imidazolonepropionase-like amidohydrolase
MGKPIKTITLGLLLLLVIGCGQAQPVSAPSATPAPTSTPSTLPTAAPTPGTAPGDLRITVLYDNMAYDARLRTGWGFAALIEYAGQTILFDTGADAPTLLGNVQTMGIDLRRIQSVALSHIHDDHVAGLSGLLATGVQPTVYVPPSFPSDFKRRVQASTRLVEVTPGQELATGIFSSGEIAGNPAEQALVIATPGGLVVITGCAHPGIVKMVAEIKGRFQAPIRLVLGGFHLANQSEAQIKEILADFRRLGVAQVAPTHCTGDNPIAQFRAAYGDDFIAAGVGRVIVVQPVAASSGTNATGAPLVLLGTLVDGSGANPVPDAVIVIQGQQIVAVGPRAQVAVPAKARRIEIPKATILPGFINAHVHNAYATDNLERWAQTGVTTVRDVGAPVGLDYFARRDSLRSNPKLARVVAAGPLVTVPNGYPIAGNNFPSLTVTSPEDARQKIDELIDAGAEVIKIALASGAGPVLSPAEASAIVETAHRRGIPVTAHATNAYYWTRALDAGVDHIEHVATDYVPDNLLRRMVERNVYLIPTLTALSGRGASTLDRFVQAGGQVALGNDSGYLAGLEIGMPMREILAMQGAGMSPMQIIVAATRNAARVCRLDQTLGTLEAGKIADVLVVEGDPLSDLNALTNVRLVVHYGEVIYSQSETP